MRGLKNVAAGANPIAIKRGIDKGVNVVVAELKKVSKEVKTSEEIAQVASISANDKEIGGKIAEAFDKVGRDGVIPSKSRRALASTSSLWKACSSTRATCRPI